MHEFFQALWLVSFREGNSWRVVAGKLTVRWWDVAGNPQVCRYRILFTRDTGGFFHCLYQKLNQTSTSAWSNFTWIFVFLFPPSIMIHHVGWWQWFPKNSLQRFSLPRCPWGLHHWRFRKLGRGLCQGLALAVHFWHFFAAGEFFWGVVELELWKLKVFRALIFL